MDTQHSERNHSESFLIAHKVRGEPAFDVAVRFKCPICEPIRQGLDPDERGSIHCNECDEGQWWWIIPTSGHRAYPSWSKSLSDLGIDTLPDGNIGWGRTPEHTYLGLVNLPEPTDPDHYQTTAAPGTGKITNLLSQLNLPRSATPQVTRRI